MEPSIFTLINRGAPQELWDSLEAGADPEVLDPRGKTPLMVAAKANRLASVLTLRKVISIP